MTLYDIPTRDLAAALDIPERSARKWKSGETKITLARLYILVRLFPSIDLYGTIEKAYAIEERREWERKNNR